MIAVLEKAGDDLSRANLMKQAASLKEVRVPMLLPGMYVRVEMPTGIAKGAFLVPQEAVSRDRRGQPLAMVVNGDNVVEQRQLTVLQDRGSDWIVSEGLSAGDRVIVMGLQKAAPGATVTPQEQATPDAKSEDAAPAPAE